MPDPLPPQLVGKLQSLSAAGRDELERRLFGARPVATARLAALRAIGAVAIGVVSAGVAIFLIVVVLNLVFHYVPT